MVDQVAFVTVTSPAGTGTVDLTSPLITEAFSGALLIFSHTTTEGSLVADGVIGMGFVTEETTGVREGHMTPTLRDSIGTANQAFTSFLSTSAVRVVCLHGTTLGVYSTSIAGGVRLSFTSPAEAIRISAVLFAGLSRASVGVVNATTVGVHEDVGDVGPGFFEPDVLLGITGDGALASSVDDGTSSFGVCINDGSETQISSFCNFDRGADPGDADGYISSSTFAVGFQIATRAIRTTTVTSFDSTGFNATSTQGTQNTVYLALKFTNPSQVRMACAQLAVAASTGLQAFNSFGFTPDVVLGRGTLVTSLDTLVNGAVSATQGLFVTGRYGSWALSGSHQEGDNRPSQADSIQEASALVMLEHASNSNGVVAWRADWGGATGSGGFYLNLSTAGQAGYLTAFGIQIIPSQVLPQRRSRERRATRLRRRPATPPASFMGRQVGGLTIVALRAIQRFRRAMRDRLRWRPRLPTAAPMVVTPSDTDRDAEGSIFSAGAVRGEVQSGGAEAGSVF